jgi:hypothetical protein
MFGLINPLYKIAGVILFVVSVFGAGYYKGYQKLSEYKTQQEMLNEQIVKRQDIITEGIKNEYKANIDRLRRTYSGVQYSKTAPTVPSKGADGASSNLLLDCAITTQQLVSLQDWMTQQLKFQE